MCSGCSKQAARNRTFATVAGTQKHSASIWLYRHQAKDFDGQPDGKIEVVLR
jgi:hypothetical protein